MTIPPFPSQDLAKLVLGYLAEEQLMTAYDEFLQASPYLDAHRNEYDRIFMTSLKSILAEYRAVKIYVETCKPFALRRKMWQCTNLLDIVKFLITNVDINKIQLQEATEKSSIEKKNSTATPNTCEVCNSLKLANCICKSKAVDVQQPGSVSASQVEASSLQNSVETTPLADLPGNHVTTWKKHVKVLEKDTSSLSSNASSVQNSDGSTKPISSHISPEEYLASCENSPGPKTRDSTLSLDSTVKAIDPSKSKQNLEEFDDVLKSVVSKNITLSGSECAAGHRISNAGTFQSFASGVLSGEKLSATYNVPDSSTSENLNVRPPITKDAYNNNFKGPPQLVLQVSHVNDNIAIQTCRAETPKSVKPRITRKSKIESKSTEHKINIISDIKVDKQYGEISNENLLAKMPGVLQNATSTPLMQTTMQTITINGMPAFKHNAKTHTYTQDEIMAMPTLIVVPASSGSAQIPTTAHCEPIMTQNTDIEMKMTSSPRVLGPLIIDVPSNTGIPNKLSLPDLGDQNPVGSGLVKTVDFKNASVPKDNVVPNKESNTPHVLPLLRKSSSTPRRSSHIRVLDFATPRRILHENMNDQVPSQSSDPPVEIVLSGSPNVVSTQSNTENLSAKADITDVINDESVNNDNGSAKENDASKVINQSSNLINPKKKKDWDADLRALISDVHDPTTKRKPKKPPKKKTANDKNTEDDKTDKKKTRKKKSPRVKKGKSKKEIEEDDEVSCILDGSSDIPVKPTINIINANYHTNELHESKKDTENNKNKSHEKDEEYNNTPENERLSLQNMIGAKLNISDLLETPYKQALYDIQMETPRFLGADLPDEPLSDIKIMSITTPRFLNTPKPAQMTPSSYSSRPTDYSSGGSYYKPDDKDYMPAPDFMASMTCPVTSSKDDISVEKLPIEIKTDDKKSRPRPVRQCTKNVSYYKSPAVANKVEDNVDAMSSCSENISGNSSFELQNKKDNTIPKTPRDKTLSQIKTETKKRNSTCRKKKSPKDSAVKDKTKSFMKIKPRYTPKKETPAGRNRKKTIKSPYSKGTPSSQQRKRTSSKEKAVNVTPVVVPMPTKSRRKSSTPRKLHCTKTYVSESSGHTSPEMVSNVNPKITVEKTLSQAHDSDNEQMALRWSDDGSQEAKTKSTTATSNEVEDITKIKEFIDSSVVNKDVRSNDDHDQRGNYDTAVTIESDGNFHQDLLKQGFDSQAAKSIETLLTDDSPALTRSASGRVLPISVEIVETKKDDTSMEKVVEKDSSKDELQGVQDETDDDEIEFAVQECCEGSNNFIVFEHDDAKESPRIPPMIPLKDNYSMEICLEDVTVRLRATPFTLVLDQDPLSVEEIDYSYKETQDAVDSISNMDRLYTPLKDSVKARVYEIFDSTLTSIDTPLKAISPVRTCITSVTELVKEKETEVKQKPESKKRKRLQGSDEPTSSKRTKPDADLLLKTANIQNIDIETVLTKLHGH